MMFKIFVRSLVLGVGLFSLPTAAYAQVHVVDWNAIIRDAQNFVETRTHYGSQISHYSEQIKKYEEQISELEKQYDAITGIKFSDLLELSVQGEDARNRLVHAYEGKGTTFGLGLPENPTKEMKEYHERYRWLKPEELSLIHI